MARTLGLALGLAAAGLFLVAMTGCGSDSDDGTGGSGGGTAGTGGATGGTGGATGGTGGATGGTGGATGGTGGATGGTGGATGGTGGATGGTGGATGGTGGATGGTGGGGDDDNDCAHATDLSSTGEGTGTIDPVDEADFYSFPFTAGDWLIVRATVTGLPADETLEDQPYEDILDTAITIFDESGTQVATMDDSFPRPTVNGMNTELIWRVPADGTYCIKVEDWATWAGETRDPAATGTYFDYDIGLYTPNQTIDAEPNNDETEAQAQTYTELVDAQDVGLGIFYSPLYGTLESATDVDVFQFTMPAGTVQLSTEDFTTPIGAGDVGVNGNGSTLQLGLVSISDTSGSIIAQLDASKGADAMNAPLEAGTDYLMWIDRSGTTAGANDFYNLVNYAWDEDNPREVETTAGANDTAATAEAMTLTTSTTNPNMDSGYILGFIDGAGTDVDYYSFTAEAGDTVSVGCGAVRSGSGLVGATFAINDSADTELQTETESDSEDIYWSDTTYGFETMPAVAITTAGTYYFVVSATSQNPNVSSNFYRCGVHVETP